MASEPRALLHELNNLLAVIVSYSELLVGDMPEEDPRRSDAVEIESAARRAAVISGLLMAAIPKSP
jgi:signal transduction histidine kinase